MADAALRKDRVAGVLEGQDYTRVQRSAISLAAGDPLSTDFPGVGGLSTPGVAGGRCSPLARPPPPKGSIDGPPKIPPKSYRD